MSTECRQNKEMRQLIAGSLILLLIMLVLDGSSAFARGRKGGGAAGALDDFDLFLMMQTTNGLPVNLVNGFESANSIAGDGTVGVGGTLAFDPLQQTINSQSGDAVTLLPFSVTGNSGQRAGMARKLGPDGLPPMLSLKSVPIPTVPELSKFIRDPKAAVVLGKALFWDMQAGSDGNACASCHFHAGADNRIKNQLSPGLKAGDQVFQATMTGKGGPNYKLKPEDFPFHRLADPLDRNSTVTFDTNDVVSSQGAFGGAFQRLGKNGKEFCGDRTAPDSFNVNGIMTRRVAPRNSPSTINAVFNYRNFWDGRANNSFNGVNPFGPRDPDAKVLEQLPDGSTVWTTIALRNASLASQAVGPALSEFEMSCANRTFKDLGRKMLALRPLRQQEVDQQDSVLGAYVTHDRRGIKQSYPELIRAAFNPSWWSSTDDFDGYSQMEVNFSLYWGLAIMMYESTLVSDETPFDKLIGDAGHPSDPKALTPNQLRGLGIFRGKGQCLSCHKGAEFTGAATSLQPDGGEGTVVESMLLKTGELGVYDNGFYNIGVRPAAEDRGVGGTDPFGNALSFTRNWFDQLRSRKVADSVFVDPCMFSIFFDASACWIAPDADGTRIVAEGAFKTPSLRNVALTQPYFHNGSRYTLEQVVEFYNRGGDRRGPDDNDTTGLIAPDAPNGGTTNLHPAIKPLGLNQDEMNSLVDFIRNALTDKRVACEQAPFDHPSLQLHNGHAGNESEVRDRNHDGLADDKFEWLSAVGSRGRKQQNCLHNDDGSVVAGLLGDTVTPPITPPPATPAPSVPLSVDVPVSGVNVPSAPVPNAPPPDAPVPVPAPVVAAPNPTTPSAPASNVTTPSVATPNNSTPNTPTPSVPIPNVPTPTTPVQGTLTSDTSTPAKVSTPNGGSATMTVMDGIGMGFSSSLVASNDNSIFSNRQFDSSISGWSGSDDSRESVNRPDSLERNNESFRTEESESASESRAIAPPSVALNVPRDVMVKSRVTLYAAVTGGSIFTWTQTEGPVVELSSETTLAPSFTAPDVPSVLVFDLTVINKEGVSVTATAIINTVSDDVLVNHVSWSKRQGRGDLKVVATTSAITGSIYVPPSEILMVATLSNKNIPAGLPGSVSNPIEVPLKYGRDMPGKPPVCESKLPCFSVEHIDGILDPRSSLSAPQFVPPTKVMVKSSLGGSADAVGSEIRIR